jgi:RimJ/RimL family protein N-acetyltransferase
MALNWKPVQPPRPVTLRGRSVTLEPLHADRHSAAIWNAVRGHDEVWAWLADGPYASESALHAALAEKQSSPSAVFFAILPHRGNRGDLALPDAPPLAAGYASYMRIDPAHGVVEVGNILLSPILQRTTAATEAMYLMARRVFDDLGYRRYEWKCNAENEPSRRAALRLGFAYEGIFRQHMVIKDRNRDTAWFAMLDQEWPARKRAFEAWLDPSNFDSGGIQKQTLQDLHSPAVRPKKTK